MLQLAIYYLPWRILSHSIFRRRVQDKRADIAFWRNSCCYHGTQLGNEKERERERERETESGVTLAHCTCSLSHFTMPHLAQDFKTGVNISKCRLFACKQLVAVSP